MASQYIKDFVGQIETKIKDVSNVTQNQYNSIRTVLGQKVAGYRSMHAHQVRKIKTFLSQFQVVGGNRGNHIVG